MIDAKSSHELEKIRQMIAGKVRVLRMERRFTQVELAAQLGLAQGRLSELERGNGSFTAEQLLLMLKLFNVPASHFAPQAHDREAQLQNALARLGAAHLHESSEALPTEQLKEVGDVIREALLARSPRYLTALAPVIVRNIDSVNLSKMHVDLAAAGLERRLVWVTDNTLEALRHELLRSLPRPLAQRYRRAAAVIDVFMDFASYQSSVQTIAAGSAPQDLLDATISSSKTRREVAEASSDISKRWGIITSLQPEDFIEALRASHAR